MSDDYRTSYLVRLNALDFRDLQDKVIRPITVLQNVTFHRTLTDRFLDAFREQVAENPVYETSHVSWKSANDHKVFDLSLHILEIYLVTCLIKWDIYFCKFN